MPGTDRANCTTLKQGFPKSGNDHRIRSALFTLLTFPNLKILNLDMKISDMASDLRAKYGIKTPDEALAKVQFGSRRL